MMQDDGGGKPFGFTDDQAEEGKSDSDDDDDDYDSEVSIF